MRRRTHSGARVFRPSTEPVAEVRSTPAQISAASPVGPGGPPIEAASGAKRELSVAKGDQ
jgi:hypothetical protein